MQNKKFLDLLASKLLEKYNYNFSNVLVILPNKRAIIFLLDALKKQSNQPFFAPKIINIQSFFQEVSQLDTIDNINLLFELYDAYCAIQEQKTNQSFIEFANWGKTALSDFNEIDNYLIDAISILNYLKDIERLKKWELNAENSNKPQDFLNFWEMLPKYFWQPTAARFLPAWLPNWNPWFDPSALFEWSRSWAEPLYFCWPSPSSTDASPPFPADNFPACPSIPPPAGRSARNPCS